MLKRAVDVVGAALGLLVLSPALLTVGLLVRATSPGPAIYRQQRVGYDGSAFAIWKFRTMRADADAELQQLLAAQGKGHQPLFKLDDDPRVTRVGRVLRTYSLDEFPQLVNVLLGHMSLVGPRPQVDAEVALYTRTHRRRLMAKPGMTGLWQVSGRTRSPGRTPPSSTCTTWRTGRSGWTSCCCCAPSWSCCAGAGGGPVSATATAELRAAPTPALPRGGSLQALLTQLAMVALGFVSGAALARGLGPDGRGAYQEVGWCTRSPPLARDGRRPRPRATGPPPARRRRACS